MSDTPARPPESEVSVWRRYAAYACYYWGLSLNHWGLRTSEQSFYRAAVGSFQRAVGLWPQLSVAYYRSGLTRSRELGEYEQGIADFTQAITLDPEWPEPYLQRGLVQRFHGNLQAAVDDLRCYLSLETHSHWRQEAERQLAQIERDAAE
jgi:tetratricopeptide (TPR) repeat protein